MSRVLVTGADGFVGRRLCGQLLKRGYKVRGGVCSQFQTGGVPRGVELVQIEPIGPNTDWSSALIGIDVIIHLAARVHVMKDDTTDPLFEYRQVNTFGTENLAKTAKDMGIKRLVYVSTIKVNGEGSKLVYTESDRPRPQGPYALSKYEAEQKLNEIAGSSKLETVIVRPPLIYGPGVKANFLRLMKTVSKGMPLPFKCVKNNRSFVYIDNLVDSLIVCAIHPNASGETFLVSDNQLISTPNLIKTLASFFCVKPRLYPFPSTVFKVIGMALGRREEIDRMIGSLCVDNSKIRKTLNWEPPYTFEEGIAKTVEWYKSLI